MIHLVNPITGQFLAKPCSLPYALTFSRIEEAIQIGVEQVLVINRLNCPEMNGPSIEKTNLEGDMLLESPFPMYWLLEELVAEAIAR